jgi:TRAP-type C4-dicarboxylate transport system substrate-binding protein
MREYDAECAAAMEELGMSYYSLTDSERAEWIAYGQSLQDQFKSLVGEDFYNQAVEILGAG